MAASYVDQYLEQGSTFTNQLTLTDSYGNPYNLSLFTVQSQAKKSYITSNVAINFVSTISDAANGVVTLSLPATTSSTVPYGEFVYDVIITDPYGAVTRVLEGRVFVSPGVTNITTSYGTDA
jgi:hypothetical protein